MSAAEWVLWTAQQDAELTRRQLAGEPYAVIAAAMGKTKNAVVGRAHRLGLPARPSPIQGAGGGAGKGAASVVTAAALGLSRAGAFSDRGRATNALRGATLVALEVSPAPAAQREGQIIPAQVVALPPTSRTHKCQWPMWGDDERPTMRFCEAPAVEARPYCPAHCRAAYVPVRTRSEADIAADEARRRAALMRVEAQRRNRLWVGL